MPKYLDTRGHTTLGIGICDRCKIKFPLDELGPDPNTPGLRVCIDDRDEYDPWRLPAREADQITLPFVRPDAPLTGPPNWVIGGIPPRPSVGAVEAGQPPEPPDRVIVPPEDE